MYAGHSPPSQLFPWCVWLCSCMIFYSPAGCHCEVFFPGSQIPRASGLCAPLELCSLHSFIHLAHISNCPFHMERASLWDLSSKLSGAVDLNVYLRWLVGHLHNWTSPFCPLWLREVGLGSSPSRNHRSLLDSSLPRESYNSRLPSSISSWEPD